MATHHWQSALLVVDPCVRIHYWLETDCLEPDRYVSTSWVEVEAGLSASNLHGKEKNDEHAGVGPQCIHSLAIAPKNVRSGAAASQVEDKIWPVVARCGNLARRIM